MKDLTLPTPAIKPCPFCGGEASARPRTCNRNTPYNPADRAFPIVRCGKCGAEAIGDDWKSEATAIEKWNRRAALSSNQAATDKESLTVAPVALGGEKGEAGPRLSKDDCFNVIRLLQLIQRRMQMNVDDGERLDRYTMEDLIRQAEKAKQIIVAARDLAVVPVAAPVGKARMLTEEEIRMVRASEESRDECAAAIRLFCEVNGITLEGGNRSRG